MMIPLLEFQVDRNSAAYNAGYMVGQMLPVLLATAGAIWCFALTRRPAINGKGVASLGILLISWAVAIVGPMTKVPALGVVGGGLCVIGALVSIVLAIAALVH